MVAHDSGIQDRIALAGKCIKISVVASGALVWALATFGAWLGLFVLDNLVSLPPGLRLPLALGGGVLLAVSLYRKVLSPAARHNRIERVARFLEERYRIEDNRLINACQFERCRLSPNERVFAEKIIGSSQGIFDRIRIGELMGLQRLFRWSAAGLALFALWAIYLIYYPQYARNAFVRFVRPLHDIPPVSSIILRVQPDRNVIIHEGDDLRVQVILESRSGVREVRAQPLIVWRESVSFVPPVKSAGENVRPAEEGAGCQTFIYTFKAVRRPFAFRAFAENTYTRSVGVNVRLAPRIKDSVFQVGPPSYTGQSPANSPGPPASVSCLPGSRLRVQIQLDQPVQAVNWKSGHENLSFTRKAKVWTVQARVDAAKSYEVTAMDGETGRQTVVARGEIGLETDRTPTVDFVNDNRNFFVNPGSTVSLVAQATDDFGIRYLKLTARTPEQKKDARVLKEWTYLGPPGSRGPQKESYDVVMDPEQFIPGKTYLMEALAGDFSPAGIPGKSGPIIVRVKTLDEISVPSTDAMALAFRFLKRAIADQKMAKGMTESLSIHLSDALARRTLRRHRAVMLRQQTSALKNGQNAFAYFQKNTEGKLYAGKLEPLLKGEMAWVLKDLQQVDRKPPDQLPAFLGKTADRQNYILLQLMSLLGKLADERKQVAQSKESEPAKDDRPVIRPEEFADDLKDDMKRFTQDQKRILERSKTLADQEPEDMTEEEEKILGELAREEAKWANFMEEKLTDFSKLPEQDFADGSLAEEFNEVFQEVKKAAEELYHKQIELAVPVEQSGLEKAEELVQNLERWLLQEPDYIKWNMEEPMAPSDIPMAELPSELEDIIGELLDSEEDMSEDIEDVSSSFLDSLDKGAGWGTSDGPISDMSAKGVTGNMLPNKMEISGRSGEGRTGQSNGQMVESTAEGKGGRETPTRLTPSPFEQGSVEDSSTENKGGATGGGKLSGFDEEGLRGPAPPQFQQKLARLAGQQARLRQQAEAIAPKLKAYNLPTGDLELSIASMKKFEAATRRGYGLGMRQSYSRVLNSLRESKDSIRKETGLQRERIKLPEWMRGEIMSGMKDGVPSGYEEMVSEYFRVLAEKRE